MAAVATKNFPTLNTNSTTNFESMAQSVPNGPFDIVATYQKLLASDPDLTMPVAAIESLLHLLAATPSLNTISETLDLLESNIAILKKAIPNAISLSAGTDLFIRYIITTLRPGAHAVGVGAGADFASIRQHLLSNAKVFVNRAKEARLAIAATAKRFVREGSTVLTTGGSRAVVAVLQEAAGEQARSGGAPRFRVVYVTNDQEASESAEAVASLRALSVPVAVIPESAVAYCMGTVSMAIVGAEGVVENGGAISRLGTYQLAALARPAGKPVYVVAESHKFVRMFPLGQFDLGVEQNILQFSAEVATPKGTTTSAAATAASSGSQTGTDGKPAAAAAATAANSYFDKSAQNASIPGTHLASRKDAVDYTPPEYITAIVTEAGVLTPSAVSEELIKIWD